MKIVFIGSGNVATQMANAFHSHGEHVFEIWSPNIENSSQLANSVEGEAVSSIKALDQNADLYIIAVKDDAINDVANAIGGVKGLVVHTSGTTGIEALSSLKEYGVLYPLQTFSKSRIIEFNTIPLCIEACNEASLDQLERIANMISCAVYPIDSAKRRVLHLSAVFACNFVNHLYSLGNKLLDESGISFEMLRPLILETALKVQHELPNNVQTGPAVRGDQMTISAHLKMLENSTDRANIYEILSDSIKKTNQ
ncbi:putative short-subunit dehydrogenase-like oxidoreductase (DUF2520 family) [Pedobacter sp. UYP24]